ncbi:MAG: NAD(P)-dependent oxidoreductase [Clostridia bacterium]|nr:NAD(P)-dependent oxidoreductase [Clostridia bacterium]
MAERERIGWIGLGIMGGHMARNLLRAGFPVTVYNRTAAKARPLLDEGAEWAPSPAAVARQADIVCTCVTGPDDLRVVALGPEGVADGARPGLLHIDFSTVSPAAAREVAAALQERGAAFLDAPVTGGEQGARQATLTIMIGGDARQVERARPVFEAVGRRIYHVGPTGAGQTMKLIANMIGGINMLAACEGLVMGLKAGLDLDQMLEVFENSTARSVSLALAGERVKSGRFEPGFSVANRYKDFVLALDEARRLGVAVPGAALAAQFYAAAMAQGLADADQTALFHVVRQLAGETAAGEPVTSEPQRESR